MKLNILQLTNRLPFPLNDGGNIATYYCTKFLYQKGHIVHLLSLNTKKHYHSPEPLQNISTQTYAIDIDTTVTPWGVLGGFFQKIPYNVSRFELEAYRKKLIMLLNEIDFDIVQMEGVYMGLYLEDVKKHSKAKVVLRAHNVEHQIWRRLSENAKNPLKKFYFKHLSQKIEQFEEEMLPQFDGVVAITADDAHFFKQIRNASPNIINIPAGIDFDVYQPMHQPNGAMGQNSQISPNSVCFLGSLEWMPNVQGLFWFLEHVWPLILEKNPKAHFHVAGKNPPESVLNLKEKQTTIHGMVEDAHAFLRQYEIMVVPLLSGSGMRLKVVEAMALSKCIVTTSIGIEGIKCESGREAMIADEPKEMAEKILLLLENEDLRTKMSVNAQNFVKKHYDWQALIDQFIDFYQRL